MTGLRDHTGGGLAEKLDAARAEVARLERQAAAATCAEIGHRWVSLGGCNCGCEGNGREYGGCSVPVHECAICGDCDYGENHDAEEVRRRCAEARTLKAEGGEK
jgi:ribosomal protein L29